MSRSSRSDVTTRRGARSLPIIVALSLALALPASVFASSYWSTLSYSYALKGTTRSYDGSNLHIDFTSHVTTPNFQNSTQWISLYRRHDCFLCNDDFLGEREVAREGFVSGQWSGVGAASYYFYFRKANDGVTIWSDDVHMWSN